MKSNYCHCVALLDRSGSMSRIINDMKGGFLSFLEDQKKLDGELTLTTVIFDTEADTLTDFLRIEKSTQVDLSEYRPRNATALIENFINLIDKTGRDLAAMKEADRPEKVLFICITDGEENASKPAFTNRMLADKISKQEKDYNWSFAYLGANQDSFAVGRGIGVRGAATGNFEATSKGVHHLYASLSASTLSYRKSAPSQTFTMTDLPTVTTEDTSK